jgi:hypothetical protein
MKDLSGITETQTGVKVKDVRFNSVANKYLGMVWDEKSYLPNKWTTCTWHKSGKCINRNRPELDLT